MNDYLVIKQILRFNGLTMWYYRLQKSSETLLNEHTISVGNFKKKRELSNILLRIFTHIGEYYMNYQLDTKLRSIKYIDLYECIQISFLFYCHSCCSYSPF